MQFSVVIGLILAVVMAIGTVIKPIVSLFGYLFSNPALGRHRLPGLFPPQWLLACWCSLLPVCRFPLPSYEKVWHYRNRAAAGRGNAQRAA